MKMQHFKTVKNLPIPIPNAGRRTANVANKFEAHLKTMEINDAVEGLRMVEVQQFYKAAKKLGMKVTARVDPMEKQVWGVERLNTIWRIE